MRDLLCAGKIDPLLNHFTRNLQFLMQSPDDAPASITKVLITGEIAPLTRSGFQKHMTVTLSSYCLLKGTSALIRVPGVPKDTFISKQNAQGRSEVFVKSTCTLEQTPATYVRFSFAFKKQDPRYPIRQTG